MKKKICCLLVIAVMMGDVLCFAGSTPEFRGVFKPELRFNAASPFMYGESRIDLLKMEIVSHVTESAAVRIVPIVRMNTVSASNGTVDFEYGLKEAYADLYSKKCDVRIGSQIVSWGACKENNAVDVINPSDYRDPAKTKADRKIGVMAVKKSLYISDFTIETVFVPFAERTLFPSQDSAWGQKDTSALDGTDLPDARFSNSELGLRISKAISGANLAVTYFNGQEDIPSMKAMTVGVLTVPDPSTLAFRRTQMLGIDFDGGLGKLGINTEVAFFRTQDLDKDPCLKNPYVQWILGLEYDLPLGIVAGLQYSREFESGTNDGISPIPGVLDDGYTPLSGLGMDLGFFTSNAVGCGFEKKFGESDLNAFELYAFYSIQAGEEGYMVSPALKLSHSDGVNVCVGMNIFGGAQGSRLEKYSDVSYFYTKIEYSF